MSEDVVLAFLHPEARAGATRRDGLHDRISLRDHVVSVDIGAFQPERGRTQRLCFNVVVEVADSGRVGDDVDRILSYDRITEAIAAELTHERLNLLETLAERIAARILLEPQACRAFVRIEKLDLGPGALGVEIVRSSGEIPAVPSSDERPGQAVVFLSNAAIVSDRLSDWLDRIEARRQPVVLVVGLPDEMPARLSAALPQRRVDLLSIEQNAWRVAARDPRCVVVDSRTEMDWHRSRRGIVVWAPSKMVLDTVEGPVSLSSGDLVTWLAGEIGAVRTVVVGSLPRIADAEMRALDAEDILA